MRRTKSGNRKYRVLLLLPILFTFLAILYYLIYDVMILGVSMTFLDIYGRGFLTWWLDSETFWGNFMLSTAKTLLLSGFLVLYSPRAEVPSDQPNLELNVKRNLQMTWLSGLLITIFIIMFVFSAYSPGSGTKIDITTILVNGWYADYMCSRSLELIFFIFNIFFLFPILLGSRRNYKPNDGNFKVFMYFSIGILIILYYNWKSEWSLWAFINMGVIFDYVSSLLFIFPLSTYFAIQLDSNKGLSYQTDTNSHFWKIHFIIRLTIMIVFMLGIYFIINTLDNGMLLEIDLKIRIETSWFFRNLLSWLYIVFLTTLLYYFAKHSNEVSK